MLDSDPLWDRHSGGEGHSGREWGDGDGTLAEAFYAALPDSAKFIFDLMMDRPGEQVTSDWIAEQLSRQYDDEARTPGRRSVSAILSSVSQPHRRSGRRLPFYWWRQNGGATLYAMKPGVALLFREARQSTAGDDADPGGGDWSASEVTAVVGDYLEMLQAEIASQQYVKAHHRRALLSRLNPVRTSGAVEYKHQNISAAMLDLGLPCIRGYKPMSNYQDALAEEIQRSWRQTPDCSGHCATASRRASRKTAKMTLRQEPAACGGRQCPRRQFRPPHHPARTAAQDATRTTGSCTMRTPAGAGAVRNW